MVYRLLRALLFRMPPERAHAAALGLVSLAHAVPPARWLLRAAYDAGERATPVEAFGLTFPNRVGLAAGYDKDGAGWRGLACLGFGHLELGTVTPRPQPGNPQPRLFRLPAFRGLINRMGFPSGGADLLARRLAGPRPPGTIVGVNLGKQKETPLEQAGEDYLSLLERFAPLADYLTVNVSSPNTPGLRELQSRQYLEGLLAPLVRRRDELRPGLGGCRTSRSASPCTPLDAAGGVARRSRATSMLPPRSVPDDAQSRARLGPAMRDTLPGRPVPVLVKLAPDLDDAQLDDALEAATAAGVDGVIATNTTISRAGVEEHPAAGEAGGLSGAPLAAMSTRIISEIGRRTGGALPVVGAGGIMTPDDAKAKVDAGAVLVQLYTGLIYRGPGLVRRIAEGLES